MDTFETTLFEKGCRHPAGVDEAGRGPLAGPVVAAAVMLGRPLPTGLGIMDSKAVSPARREKLVHHIFRLSLAVGLGIAWHDEIDRLNIHRATLLAMERAAGRLSIKPDFLLIDGKFTIDYPCPQEALVRGDGRSVSIAAASIIAKTTRDRIMCAYERRFPGYGFDRHKGYGTREHLEALGRLGPCPVHRKTFRGVLSEEEKKEEKKREEKPPYFLLEKRK